MRIVLLVVVFGANLFQAEAQKEMDQDWNGFFQEFDVLNYGTGKFRLRAFVKVEGADKYSQAQLWARVNNKKGVGFFDNMHKRPIVSENWTEYTIEGDIGPSAKSLVVGGLYFGFGTYCFDNFTLEFQKANSTWEIVPFTNSDFESNEIYNGWKSLFSVKGYELALSTINVFGGAQSLVIDGLKRSTLSFGNNREAGKYQMVNGIKMYYEEYGTGEELLLLHGNGESIASFKNQIPDFSKMFRVIALDSRGQGRTTQDGKKLTYELMAEDVNSFLSETGLTNVNVVGWSDGGNIGLILAMMHPEKVKRLSIMGANLYNDKTSVDDKMNKSFRSLRASIVEDGEPGSEFSLQLIDLALHEPRISPEQLKAIDCPTLVMAGSNDIILESHTKLIASKIKDSKLIIFDKGTHYEPRDNPGRFNKAVLEFLTVR
jgi:pimeloyl-ACP methyl ester carboxylesterase